MRRLLLLRLSAFGDQIHAAPVVADLLHRFPGLRLDWAVDERFADVPRRVAGVHRVIALPLKRWQRAPFARETRRDVAAALRALRAERYDVALDAQGLWKSALVARLAHARLRIGFVPAQCGEAGAARFYDRHIELPRGVHGVDRVRALAARALDTDPSGPPDFGLRPAATDAFGTEPVAVLVHGASKDDKLWPEESWVELGRHLVARGLRPVLPAGSEAEQARAERLARAIGQDRCILPPQRPLSWWIDALGGAALVAGVDTGFTHLAAALGVPVVAIFTSTSPGLFRPARPQVARVLGGDGARPAAAAAIAAVDALHRPGHREAPPARRRSIDAIDDPHRPAP